MRCRTRWQGNRLLARRYPIGRCRRSRRTPATAGVGLGGYSAPSQASATRRPAPRAGSRQVSIACPCWSHAYRTRTWTRTWVPSPGRLRDFERRVIGATRLGLCDVSSPWWAARLATFSRDVHESPLAQTPCDLRHACVSTWLNGGVPATQVAEWAGHSVEVLLKIYVKCLDGHDEVARRRVQEALGYGPT
jgi:hypothetical protein